MKHTQYIILIIFLILFGCFGPNQNNGPYEVPEWLLAEMVTLDNSTDSLQIESITRYDYLNEYVYYFKNFMTVEPHLLYNSDGIVLGKYLNGDWIYLSDSIYTDFHSNKSNDSLLWVNSLQANPDTTQDYEIINALLEYLFSNRSFVHIDERTDANVDLENLTMHLAGGADYNYHRMLLQSLYTKNLESIRLDSTKILLPTARIFTKSERDDIFCDGSYPNAWNNYYGIYPQSNGFIRLGLPALDPTNTMAFIEISFYSNYLAASGNLFVLEKQESNWVVVHVEMTWIS